MPYRTYSAGVTRESVTLASVINRIAADPGMKRAAMLSSATTGNPTIRAIRTGEWPAFVFLNYDEPGWPGASKQPTSLDVTRTLAARLGLTQAMDLVVVDPFHTYSSSVRAIALGLEMLRPGGSRSSTTAYRPPIS